MFAAREECDRLQSIVDELLDLSRIQADRIELRARRRRPRSSSSREALDASARSRPGRNVELRSELMPGHCPRSRSIASGIGLVLANLSGNASATARGRRGHGRARTSSDGALRFEVGDRGPGVPRRLPRTRSSTSTCACPGAPAGGAGLGLYIAREIVRAHGGEIGVGDREGGGATF